MSTHHQWSIGQKALCIDDKFPRYSADWCNALPIAGYVYTIRGMQLGSDPITGRCGLGFLLEEISSPRKADGRETGFFHTRFVPWLESVGEYASAAEQRELAEEVFGIPAPRARSKAILNAPGKVQHPGYACALGLARLANISS
jgi:hypothetical protein